MRELERVKNENNTKFSIQSQLNQKKLQDLFVTNRQEGFWSPSTRPGRRHPVTARGIPPKLVRLVLQASNN